MVWLNAQTAAFFTDADQMALVARTVGQLALEGITTVDDLAEFEDGDFKQLVNNLKYPPQIPDPANAANLIHDTPYVVGAKSLRRLKVAAAAVRYYQSIDRTTTPGSMNYSTTLKHFEQQWQALTRRTEETPPSTPLITRNLKVTRWSEAFTDFLHRVNGVRHAPLAYVIRAEATVPAAAPRLATNRPYSAEHGSVEGELIARLSHDHPLFRDDNAKVYYFLEEATRSTQYSSSLKPYQRAKDGRAAFMALISQHAGVDKWERELKSQETFLTTRVWKGNTNFSLDKFIEQHRAAYISMEQCSLHVAFQLPNETTRVRYLMEAIQCPDAELQASLAAIRMDTAGPTAKRNHFENAASFLLPSDPVMKKRKLNGERGTNATVSAVTGSGKLKVGTGKTGVQFRYYPRKEYRKLNDDQRAELNAWREKNDPDRKKRRAEEKKNQGEKDGRPNKKLRFAINSVLKEKEQEAEKTKASQEEELQLIKEAVLEFTTKATASSATASKPSTADATATIMATKLQKIMRPSRSSNSGSEE